MRYNIIFFITLAICSCRQSNNSIVIRAVYPTGIVEYNACDNDMYSKYVEQYKRKMKSQKIPDRIYCITPEDYSFMYDVLCSPKKETTKSVMPAPIVIKFNSIMYVIGDNRVVETNGKLFLISEYEDYKIKCLVHYYDNFSFEDLLIMNEVQKYGVPANYLHIPSDSNRPPKLTVKVLLLG